jgi:hypothetical protein
MINNFLSSLNEDLDSIPDRDLALAYKGFLHRIVEAQLARLFAQSDPSGARVLRNIRDAVKLSERFVIKKDFRGNVLFPLSTEPLEHLEPFPTDELEQFIAQSANSRQTIPQILDCLHELLSNQEKYRRTIVLTDIALIVKNVYQSDFSPETSVEHSFPIDGLSDFELSRVRHDVENVLKERILLTYLAKGKVTGEEARALFGALHDIVDEWCDGNSSSDSLYAKFNSHYRIAPELYDTEYRSKMEYLLKIARQEFVTRLTREL